MSLVAITSSRHLCRSIGAIPASRRHFAKGSGLQRPKPKTKNDGRRPTTPKSTTISNAKRPLKEGASIEMFETSTTSNNVRISGTEAVAGLSPEAQMSNYAMAGGLLVAVSYIFYYSLASVGGGDSAWALLFGSDEESEQEGHNPGFEEFLKEANEKRMEVEDQLAAEKTAKGEAQELVELENTTTATDLIVAGANVDEEREMARIAGFDSDSTKGRSLWRRVIFF